MAGRLNGKVALISGAARGQGEAEARMFVNEGAAVVLGDILVAEGEKVVSSIRAGGGQATFVKLDVTQETDWKQAVDTTVQTYGKLNILVNNAGIFPIEGVEATSMELWNRVVAINQTGVWLGMKAAVPAIHHHCAAAAADAAAGRKRAAGGGLGSGWVARARARTRRSTDGAQHGGA